MKRLDVSLHQGDGNVISVGSLAERDRRVYFEYSRSFLQTGLELSPLRLQARPGVFEHTDRAFGSLPGLFDDSLPDGWGLLLMDRHFRKKGIDPASVSPLDRLAFVGQRAMGALSYHPSESLDDTGNAFDLGLLAREAEKVFHGDARDVIPELLKAGGSPGGARPKVLVGFRAADGALVSGAEDLPAGFEHWIVKFSARADWGDPGPIEYAYSQMAVAAGISMPPARLFETGEARFFGVKRFDRTGPIRHHVHTFGNLIQANFRLPTQDYTDLLKVTQFVTRRQPDVVEAFRRMVFNILSHNRDDHVKNFAFILDAASKQWRLSPAYDLIYSTGPGGEHTMTVAGEGRRPALAQVREIASRISLPSSAFSEILDQVRNAIARWPTFAEASGVSQPSMERIRDAMSRTGI